MKVQLSQHDVVLQVLNQSNKSKQVRMVKIFRFNVELGHWHIPVRNNFSSICLIRTFRRG